MRTNACLCCVLLTVPMAAAPSFPIAIGQARPAAAEAGNDMAPAPDNDEE